MFQRLRLLTIVAWTLSGVAVPGQVRDPAATPDTGTAAIGGQVLTNDPQPRPIRRAIVTVSGGVPGGRGVVTDDEGRFEIAGLPAGRYTVSAAKTAYLTSVYGAVRPGRTGTAVVLAPGQRFTAVLRMIRGAVLTGTVRDEHGQPAGGVEVRARNARGALPGTSLESAPVTTDDRGVYRLFGLMPGDYYVSATGRLAGSGTIDQRSTADIDAALAALRQRAPASLAAGTVPSRGKGPAAIPQARPIAYAPTYFPGVSELGDAARITAGFEEERGGIDFALTPVRVTSMEGTVGGAAPSLAAVQLSLISLNDEDEPSGSFSTATSPILSMPPDAEGRFRYTRVLPGRYRIVARASRSLAGPSAAAPPIGNATFVGRGGGGGIGMPIQPAAAPGEFTYAVADARAQGEDLTGLSLVLQPGSTFSGRIQFDATTLSPPKDQTSWQVRLLSPVSYMALGNNTLYGSSLTSVTPGSVGADGRFELSNIAPGSYRIEVSGPERKEGWWIRSAVAEGRDLLDLPPDFTPGLTFGGVVVTLSDRHTELTGTLQTPAGAPAPDYFVIAFPSDPPLWRAGSRRVQSARPATDGAFVIRDLPPGSYLIAALTDVAPSDLNDSAFLQQVAPSGVPVVLGEGEKKVQDLRIATQ